jgi:uncharacterized protein YggL (DUF469 family)
METKARKYEVVMRRTYNIAFQSDDLEREFGTADPDVESVESVEFYDRWIETLDTMVQWAMSESDGGTFSGNITCEVLDQFEESERETFRFLLVEGRTLDHFDVYWEAELDEEMD